MKILIDINHPAHVHYFKGFIRIMQNKGHEIIVINRNSKIINELLNRYNIDHVIRHKRPLKNSTFRSLWYLCRIILFIIGQSLKKRPDIYIGFASAACAINSFIFRKKSILFDDTEHNHLNHILYKPFCSTLYTPFYFEKEMGKKQNHFNAYMEQLYLHSDYFENDTQILSDLGLAQYDYVLVRYIAYDARHDRYIVPFSDEIKKQIVRNLSKTMKVIVSCENDVYDDFYEQYSVSILPDKMHYLIANAKLLISEGATMACEAGLLGTPYLYINPLRVGYLNLQTNKYIHAEQCSEESDIFPLIEKLLTLQWGEKERMQIRQEIEAQTINPTEMLIDYIERLNQ
jgi:predicted glycosyltransferase